MVKDKQSPVTTWIVCDQHKVGTLNQCLGLADLLGLTPQIKRVEARFPWRYLPSRFWVSSLKTVKILPSLLLESSWPDLIIGGGRQSAVPVALMGRMSQGKTKTIQILNPYIDTKKFDCVISPYHDHVKGENVTETLGALNAITEKKLGAGAVGFEHFSEFPRPLIAVLIGAGNKYYRFGESEAKCLGQVLKDLHHTYQASFLITLSRRTPAALSAYLKTEFEAVPHYLWDNQLPNPYLAMLFLSDALIVTSDSVSMSSEACATGKPVYIFELPGTGGKFKEFYSKLYQQGHAAPLEKEINFETPFIPLKEGERVAHIIKSRFCHLFEALN